jgi:hypothetical protein
MANARFLLAANDRYGLVFAVFSRNRYGLRRTAGHIGYGWRRRSRRAGKKTGRIPVCPIPGNIIFVGVIYIA